VLINRIGWKTYLIFMILLALFVPFVWWAYPETSGLSLEEVDNLFLPEDHQNEVVRSHSISGGSTKHAEAGKSNYSYEVEKV
jgi:hypothetical protein